MKCEYEYAKKLAVYLWETHYKTDAPEWKPCEDLMGVLTQIDNMITGLTRHSTILTCVYCGMQYPEGTPPHGAKILTDHIKVCKKHPMREAEQKIKILREALIELVGASMKEELEKMKVVLQSLPPSNDAEKLAGINAIHALLVTMDKPGMRDDL